MLRTGKVCCSTWRRPDLNPVYGDSDPLRHLPDDGGLLAGLAIASRKISSRTECLLDDPAIFELFLIKTGQAELPMIVVTELHENGQCK